MTSELENGHLADLHAIAADLGVERYRLLPKSELVAAILERDPDASAPEREEAPEEAAAPAERSDEETPRPRRRERGGRNRGGGRGGRDRRPRRDDDLDDDAPADDGDAEGEEEADAGEPVAGVLDITPRGHGFIRLGGLESSDDDVYVSPSQIRRCEMQRGDEVAGPARKPRRGERYPALIHVDTINGVEPGSERPRLGDATPVHPSRRIDLAPGAEASDEDKLLLRAVDLLNPLAFGQRVLVRSTKGSGRTTLLRALAASLASREDLELVVLLIDERPEEAAGWRDAAPGADLAIASAELRSGEQLRMVELAFGRASRRAEAGSDVVLIVDSLSRIAVAADDPGRVKPIFTAGRETEEEGTGSLTVIATVLGDDEDDGGIGRALDTTETSLIVLDRDLAQAGTYPAFDAAAGRLAGEEHIRSDEELALVRTLRSELTGKSPAEAAALLRERIESTPDNAALLGSLSE
jgi:transcription termination factor Rho